MKFINQAILHNFPLHYTVTETSCSHFHDEQKNKTNHVVLVQDGPDLNNFIFDTDFKVELFIFIYLFIFTFSSPGKKVSFILPQLF